MDKKKIIYSGLYKLEADASNRILETKSLRGSTDIEGNSNTLRVINSSGAGNFYSVGTRMLFDSPATTFATTYKVQMKTSNAAATAILAESGSAFIAVVEYEP